MPFYIMKNVDSLWGKNSSNQPKYKTFELSEFASIFWQLYGWHYMGELVHLLGHFFCSNSMMRVKANSKTL